MVRECIDCSKEFEVNLIDKRNVCYVCLNVRSKIPCEKCGLLKKKNSKLCRNCYIPTGLIGDKNPRWTGGRTYEDGYVLISSRQHPNHNSRGYVREHTLVMEEILGRYLEPGENVHHINGIKDDNRPENLELWISPQPSGIRAQDAVEWAKEILVKYSDLT